MCNVWYVVSKKKSKNREERERENSFVCDHHQSKKRLEYFEYTLVLLLRLRLRRRRRLKTRRIRRRRRRRRRPEEEEEEDFCRRNTNGPDGLYSRVFFFQHEYTYYSKEDLSLASSEKESSSSSSSSSASRSFRSFSNCRLDLISTSMKSLGSVNPSVSLSKPSMAPTL